MSAASLIVVLCHPFKHSSEILMTRSTISSRSLPNDEFLSLGSPSSLPSFPRTLYSSQLGQPMASPARGRAGGTYGGFLVPLSPKIRVEMPLCRHRPTAPGALRGWDPSSRGGSGGSCRLRPRDVLCITNCCLFQIAGEGIPRRAAHTRFQASLKVLGLACWHSLSRGFWAAP